MTCAWIIGSGGMLGSALGGALRRDASTRLFIPGDRFAWHDWPVLAAQLATAVASFAACTTAAEPWEIYWAAGVGTMGSSTEALAQETRALALLLERIAATPHLTMADGAVVLASSAGAVYAGAADALITEATMPAPTTAYARAKLAQEELLRIFAATQQQVQTQVARISTLYGHTRHATKQQGLLTHMARSILRRKPIQIYVPYDTIRDYIAADDAAVAMIASLRAAGPTRPHPHLTRIIASEQPATIAEIIAIFKRVARRAPRIVTSASRLSDLYTRRIQFRSVVLPDCPRPPVRSLLVGIAELMNAERDAFARAPHQ